MSAFAAGVKGRATGHVDLEPRGEGEMEDKDIRGQIHALVEEEHALRNAADHTAEQRARIAQLEQDLDQLWDLLRQRDAKRQYGEDPDQAKPRPEPQVENYLQ
jgi:hypothetical protein